MKGDFLYIKIFLATLYFTKCLFALMNMFIYHATAKSSTLPFDNKETPSLVLLSFASFSYIKL